MAESSDEGNDDLGAVTCDVTKDNIRRKVKKGEDDDDLEFADADEEEKEDIERTLSNINILQSILGSE